MLDSQENTGETDQEEGGGAGLSRKHRRDQEQGGGAGLSSEPRRDQEEGGGAGPSREPRRDQEEGRWSWTLKRTQERLIKKEGYEGDTDERI